MTPRTFCQTKRRTLVSLLKLATADTFDGERIGALAGLGRMMQAADLTWDDLIIDPEAAVWRPPPPRPEPNYSGNRDLPFVRMFLAYLTDCERNFIVSVSCRSNLTQKQADIVQRIAQSLRAKGFE